MKKFLSEGHGKLLASLPTDRQYWFAYEAIKKEWSVGTLDDAIKTLDEKKRETSLARKASVLASPIEQQLTEQLGFPMKVSINKNEIHYMAREIDEWLPQGIQSLADGTYSPRCLKRYYFSDEVVDQVHLSDRIFQHVLLKQLKPTFKHVMNQVCRFSITIISGGINMNNLT